MADAIEKLFPVLGRQRAQAEDRVGDRRIVVNSRCWNDVVGRKGALASLYGRVASSSTADAGMASSAGIASPVTRATARVRQPTAPMRSIVGSAHSSPIVSGLTAW